MSLQNGLCLQSPDLPPLLPTSWPVSALSDWLPAVADQEHTQVTSSLPPASALSGMVAHITVRTARQQSGSQQFLAATCSSLCVCLCVCMCAVKAVCMSSCGQQ